MSTQKITATNYTAILSTVTSVLTTYYGYGQYSKSVSTGVRVTAADWDNLYRDINHALIHQTGNRMPFDSIQSGDVLTTQFVNSLTNYAAQINANKVPVSGNPPANQLISYPQISTRSGIWGSNITHEAKFIWPDTASAQSFFNQGSYLLATIARTVDAAIKPENIIWSNLLYNAALLLAANPQVVRYNLTNYLGTYAGYSYVDEHSVYTIDFSYTKVDSRTIIGKIVFNTQETIELDMDVLPSAGFREYQSVDTYGGTLAPSPDIIILQTLDVGGATLFPALLYTPFALTNIPNLVASTSKTVTVTNTGSGVCTITGVAFFSQAGSGITGTASIGVSTLAPNASANITVAISTLNGIEGTYPGSYLELYSNSITGNTLRAKIPITITSPGFVVALTPNPVVVPVVTSDPVITHFSFGAGITGNVYSLSGSLSTSLSNRLFVTAISTNDVSAASKTPNNKTYGNLLYTTFLPPTSNVLGDVVGTYNATLTVTFTPYDYTQSAFTVAVPLTFNVNIPNRHLGDWLSAKDQENGVMGASYDIINGVRTLTLGFGMGQDGGPPLNRGGVTYANAKNLGINGDAYPSLGIPLFPANIPDTVVDYWFLNAKYKTVTTSDFLKQYGSWPTVNGGGGHQSTFDLTYTFTAPIAGYYTTQFCSVGTSSLHVNGNQISTSADRTTPVAGSCYLNAGVNTVRIIATSAGGRDLVPGYWTIYKYEDGTEQKRVYTAEVPGIPWLGSFAATIKDSNGYTWWDTRRPVRTAYPYWAEVYRIPLTQGAHLYKSGNYLVKTNDFALGKNYGAWLGRNEFEGHAYVVIDDGNGNLNISINPWKADKSTGDLELNRTLMYSVSLPFYYTQLSKRFTQLAAPIGLYTKFFVGFKRSGELDVRRVKYPYPYKEPLAPNAKPGEEPKTFWANLLVAVVLGAAAFVATVAIAAAVFTSAFVAANALVIVAVAVVVAVVVAIVAFVEKVCFTGDSLISMADGTFKPIKDVQIGDLVFNRHKTESNRVTFVEKTLDDNFGYLYSISADEEPFITVNHPMYINDKLSSVYPEKTYNAYPWLGMTELLIPDRMVKASGQDVYNLWVTGDGTFIVNGYGTTSIMGDGGWARLLAEQGISTPERVSEVLQEFASSGKESSYGAYVCNKFLGKLDIKFINKTLGKVMDSRENTISRRAIKYVFKLVGKVAVYLAERKMRK